MKKTALILQGKRPTSNSIKRDCITLASPPPCKEKEKKEVTQNYG